MSIYRKNFQINKNTNTRSNNLASDIISNVKGRRYLTKKVNTAKGKRASSTKWLQRHLNDDFVMYAKDLQFRSRAAFKLIEIQQKFNVFTEDIKNVVDLGSAPGGWSQVALMFIKDNLFKRRLLNSSPKVISIDLKPMDYIEGVDFIEGDFTLMPTQEKLFSLIGNLPIDLVMTDMAPNFCGHKRTDHLLIMELVENALDFAINYLREGGCFITKILQGPEEKTFIRFLKQNFSNVRYYKPSASRKDSAEIYIVAQELCVNR